MQVKSFHIMHLCYKQSHVLMRQPLYNCKALLYNQLPYFPLEGESKGVLVF